MTEQEPDYQNIDPTQDGLGQEIPQTEALAAADQPPNTESSGGDTISAESPVETSVAAKEPAQPGIFKRFFRFLFNPETRFGRTMRKITQTLAMIIGFFALGFLVAYIWLIRPAQQSLNTLQVEAQSLQSQLTTTNDMLEIAQKDLAQAQSRTKTQQTRIQVLSVLDLAHTTNQAILYQEPEDKVLELAAATSTQLDQVLPKIQELEPDTATAIKKRLELILNEISTTPDTAISDLDIFIQAIKDLDNRLGR